MELKFSCGKLDSKGQLPIEYIMTMGVIFLVSLLFLSQAGCQSELNTALASARSGAIEGANMNSFALYPEETFQNYTSTHNTLTKPATVRIISIEYKNQGLSPTYRKEKIQIKVHASAPSVKNPADRNCLGDRINYHVRMSISQSFKTENLTNKVFNPAFSPRYVFTTCDVAWV
ncbi:hypothetical protein [Methanobacterium aggregans]|uniref:hypothetical protein n=1 Tax=Methanobacterium aggregans TaxID=1615586 RepID=UPI001AE210CB|nr:hypothetical protein [Methanobacterium aggregans]MBP2046897.1 uncharacterized protein (UPF0333 family) [Methanobacterium aggregans]